ncbi:PE-PGRS family protein [Streptomyces sp. WMMB 322]|uniref:PE-PGRS family protein n=1 Tax=Streptomyces sp. WMMB 322 TaxID=1286821 RepID=UPI0020C76084|nr:PE-PGRS family protein [Streptomyces sp. WMMB 322]
MTSGHTVPAWMLAVGWAGTAGVAWFLTGRERGPLLVGALTVFTQFFLHTAFSLGQATTPQGAPSSAHAAPPGLHATRGTGGTHGSHGMHATDGQLAGHAHDMSPHMQHGTASHAPPATPGSGGDVPAPLHGGHGDSTGMLAAHLLVALLSAWWMWGGERAVFQLLRVASAKFFGPLLTTPALSLPAPIPVLRPGRPERRRAPRQFFLSHVIWLRGPPGGRAV